MLAQQPILGWVPREQPQGNPNWQRLGMCIDKVQGGVHWSARRSEWNAMATFVKKYDFKQDVQAGYLLVDRRYEQCIMFQHKRKGEADTKTATVIQGTELPAARIIASTPNEIEFQYQEERHALVESLVKAGISFQIEWSYDGDEQYVLCTLPSWRMDLEGERLRVRVTRRPHHPIRAPPVSRVKSLLWGGVKQCDDTGYAGYAPFDTSRKEEYIGAHDPLDPTSCFTSAQRQHIVSQVLESQVFPFGFYIDKLLSKARFFQCEATAPRERPAHIDPQNGKEIHHDDKEYLTLSHAVKKKVVSKIFPLHEDLVRKQLLEAWAKNWRKQPLTKIRNYFGGQVAFYFAWLGFYTTWLIVPSVLGLALFIVQMLTDIDSILLPGFCFFMAIWSVLFLEFWKRQQSTLAFKWGTGLGSNWAREEVARPEFTGPLRRSVVTGEFERFYPTWKRRLKMLLATPVLSIFVFCVIIFLVGMLAFKESYEFACGSVSNCQNPVASISTAVFILVMNKVYGYFAVWITDWENHRTESRHENSLVLKTFAFQFVNSFTALFYLAFKPDPDLSQLALQLASNLFVKEIFMQLKEFFLPWAMKWWALRSEDKNRQHLQRQGYELTYAAPVELEEHLPVLNGTIDDYAEMMIQYGYVTLFVAAFPLAPLAALINDLFEIRVDAAKYCSQVRRPTPRDAQDIGSWMTVLTAITGIAVITNAAILTMSSDEIPSYFPGISSEERIWLLFGIEHVVFVLQMGIAFLVPNVPQWVRREAARQEYDAQREFYALLDHQHSKGTVKAEVTEHSDHESDDDDAGGDSISVSTRNGGVPIRRGPQVPRAGPVPELPGQVGSPAQLPPLASGASGSQLPPIKS
eukprot:TRINITY_DN4151_c1_g1_i7.p1 TRINITY_DN4151_c1_g1~~TRINITY_DN4151_c1_g1_i7.p1  ORF type:complete len:860 (-),score=163.98 TRINITY_DN4151_c1_g1_i7:135-2714(-)